MPPAKRKLDADEQRSLKPFTIISGEPKNIDCYLGDGSLKLFWANTKEDVIAHLLRSDDKEVKQFPLSHDRESIYEPSDYHHVMCRDGSCPCSKNVMCWECVNTKEAVPKDGIKVHCNGYEEELSYPDPPTCCQCETPDFRGLNKVRLVAEAIESYCDSDHCFKLIELDVQDPIPSAGDDEDDTARQKRKCSLACHASYRSTTCTFQRA
jgi:hypothetical protein